MIAHKNITKEQQQCFDKIMDFNKIAILLSIIASFLSFILYLFMGLMINGAYRYVVYYMARPMLMVLFLYIFLCEIVSKRYMKHGIFDQAMLYQFFFMACAVSIWIWVYYTFTALYIISVFPIIFTSVLGDKKIIKKIYILENIMMVGAFTGTFFDFYSIKPNQYEINIIFTFIGLYIAKIIANILSDQCVRECFKNKKNDE